MTDHQDNAASGLCVPDIPTGADTLTAALDYARAGFYVLPIKRGTKNPGSIVMGNWQSKSSRDLKVIAAWLAGTDRGIALHCGRSGVVVFDVDHPDKVPPVLAKHLPAALFQATRPDDDPQRGHYVFAMPAGRTIGNSTGRLAAGWGEVRGLNGVIVVAPNDDGRCWMGTGAVPELPEEIAELLGDASPAEDAATDETVTEFIAKHVESSRPQVLIGLVSALIKKSSEGESRHQSTVGVLTGAMKEARIGLYSAQEAIDVVKPMFITAVMKPPSSSKQGSARTADEAESEFAGILAWAVGQALGADPDQIRKRVDEKMPDDESLFDGEPIPLTRTVPIPAFPVDSLPKPIADMVNTVAEATQTDPAMAATSALSVLSACNGGHAEIEIRPGWRESLNIYTATIAAPGERKSAVQMAMVRPVLDVEQQLAESGMEAHLEAKARKQIAMRNAEKLRNMVASKIEDEADGKIDPTVAIDAAVLAESIEIPAVPRIVADDITPEATASLLAEQKGRLAVISAEGGIFDIIAGRYTGHVPNLDVFLKGHAGDPIKIDRKGRPSENIRRPALTLGLMIQPEVLTTIAANRQFRGRGLLARFLYACPETRVGHRIIAPTPPDPDVVASYEATVRNLASGMAEWLSDPAVLVLTPAAHEAVLAIETAVEPTLAAEGALASLADWGAKYVGVIMRIAGNLHLVMHGPETGPTTPVGAETILAANRIGEYFKACAINAFTEMGTDHVTADAIYLLGRISRLGLDEVSERDMHVAARPRLRTKDDLMPAVQRLVDHGYLALVPTKPSKERGRPASPRYRVWEYSTQTT